jgi:hypothetical protein
LISRGRWVLESTRAIRAAFHPSASAEGKRQSGS